MTKREFIESVVLRCSNLPEAKPYYLVRYALQCWEALEQYGEKTSEEMPVAAVAVVTGPRNPLSS